MIQTECWEAYRVDVNSFIFYKDWWDLIKDSPPEEQIEFLIPLIKYGIEEEETYPETWDKYRRKVLSDAYKHIIADKNRYKKVVENGKTRGRSQLYDREELKKLIAAGRNAQECAVALGVTRDAIYHDSVWSDRNKNGNNCYRDD